MSSIVAIALWSRAGDVPHRRAETNNSCGGRRSKLPPGWRTAQEMALDEEIDRDNKTSAYHNETSYRPRQAPSKAPHRASAGRGWDIGSSRQTGKSLSRACPANPARSLLEVIQAQAAQDRTRARHV